MKFENIWKDLRTTVIGVVLIIGATVALIKGLCTFYQWWQVVIIVVALVGGAASLSANTKKPPE